MFYTMCMKCGEQWALGDERSCKCKPKTEAMTQEDVIQMARQAELLLDISTTFPYAEGTDIGPMLEKFAALVAAAERKKCANFVEACAGLSTFVWKSESDSVSCQHFANSVAAAIRARGDQT